MLSGARRRDGIRSVESAAAPEGSEKTQGSEKIQGSEKSCATVEEIRSTISSCEIVAVPSPSCGP